MGGGASKTPPAAKAADQLFKEFNVDKDGKLSLVEQAIAACEAGDATALESLLKAGAAPNAADEDGITPLIVAARDGHAECVTLLLASPAIDVNQAKNNGGTPLIMAAQAGRAECVTLLLASPSVAVNQANNGGTTPLYTAAQDGHTECMTLLLASPSIDVNQATNGGATPLFIAAQKGHAECVTLLLASPSVAVNQAENDGVTPLIIASRSRATAAALALIADERTELDTKDSAGRSALSCASEGDNAQLVAALIARGADPLTAFPNPLVADCVVGRALEARARLEGQPQAADDDALPELTRLCLVGTPAQVEACEQSKTACETVGAMPPPLATAVELMHARGNEGEAIVRSLLGAMEGVKNEEQRDALLGAARSAAAAAAAVSTAAYAAGTAYHAFIVACVDAGLIDECSCSAAKKLVLTYIGSIAASSHMAAVGRAFDGLKTACTRRLERIAAPLEAMCEREELCSRLGSIGASIGSPPVALDDASLLPMPKRFYADPPDDRGYEPYLIELIYMVSLALDDLFVDKLRKALMPFGDGRVGTLDDGKGTLRISKGGVPQIDITRAPVKSHARMLNKLESADDHRDKPLPRPKWNVDTVRAGVVVHDAALLAQVYDAIAAHVGIFLRVKNAFAEGAVVNYGYRAILGNLRLESGLTVGRVFGGAHTAKWEALAEVREVIDAQAPHKMDAVLGALLANTGQWQDEHNAGTADLPLNIAAEVQLIYLPYLDKGRKLSHLPYKVVRCETAPELARDAGGKKQSAEVRAAVKAAECACMDIVAAELRASAGKK